MTDSELRSAMKEAVIVERRSNPEALADAMQRFYSAASFQVSWFDRRFRPLRAREVLAVLFEASTHGMDPRADSVMRLSTLLGGLAHQENASPSELARIDLALTAALFRYLAHLHNGRIDPRQVVPTFTPADDKLDLPELVRRAESWMRPRRAARRAGASAAR